MSQFATTFDDSTAPRSTSKLAIASLVCSLIFFCPVTTILGPLLGLIALVTMGARKGRVLAVLGVLIGAVFTAGWVWGGYWMYGKARQVMEGPNAALTAGFQGDIAGFKAQFYGPGASAGDDVAAAFIDELRARYGEFQSSHFNDTQVTQPQPGQPSAPFPYVLTFANGAMNGEAEMIFADQTTGQVIMKLGYVVVFDPAAGDLRYPPAPGGP